MRHYREALTTIQHAGAHPPTAALDFFDLAMAYAELDCWGCTLDTLRQAIRLQPGYAAAHFALAVTCLTCGLPQAAWDQYHLLHDLDESSAAELLQLLRLYRYAG